MSMKNDLKGKREKGKGKNVIGFVYYPLDFIEYDFCG